MREASSGLRGAKILLALAVTLPLACATVPNPGRVEQRPTAPLPLPAPTSFEDVSFQVADTPEASPYQLTSSDGTGLRLSSYRSRTVVEGPLAFTEVDLTFDNPESRIIEGHFEVRLPVTASLSRFAMQIDNAWQEGEVVEKKEAQKAYEAFLHRRRDPALLEQGAANTFSARVFPIGAKTSKHIRLGYSEILRSGEPLSIRLSGMGKMDNVLAEVFAANQAKPLAKVEGKDLTPTDLVVPIATSDTPIGLRKDDIVLMRLPIRGTSSVAAKTEPDTLYVLVDSSASRSLDWNAECARTEGIIHALDPRTNLVVASFDQSVTPLYKGQAKDFDDEAAMKLQKTGALGASDLDRALTWVASGVDPRSLGSQKLMVITDGVATVGGSTPQALGDSLKRLRTAGVSRVDVLGVGAIRDEKVLRALADSGANGAGTVAEATWSVDEIVRRITRETLPDRNVAIEGATWISTPVIRGAQPGDVVTVFAEVPHTTKNVSVRVGDERVDVPLTTSDGPLLERAWATSKIESLEAENENETTRKTIVDLSTRYRVLSRYTGMLVLETDDDYKRYEIDRKSKGSILTVAEGGRLITKSVDRDLRSLSSMAPHAQTPSFGRPMFNVSPASASASNAGTLDHATTDDDQPSSDITLSGVGEGGGGRAEGVGLGAISGIGHGSGTGGTAGFGSGSGRLSGSHKSKTPSIRMGATQVSGRLPPEVIQRIVRQNFGRFRLCYENELRVHPQFSGRVAIQFEISHSGTTKGAAIQSSASSSAPFNDCLVKAFGQLTFPEPDSGIVHVVYPIQFGHGDDAEDAPIPFEPHPHPALPAPDPTDESAPWAGQSPYTGTFARVMDDLSVGEKISALKEARIFARTSPDDALAFVALGEAAEANGNQALAARAYGSLLELWSYRADMRRFAGERLDRLTNKDALALSIDTYRRAASDRPDNPSGQRLLAYALARSGDLEGAFETIKQTLTAKDQSGSALVQRVLSNDLGLIGSALRAKEPSREAEIVASAANLSVVLDQGPSVRFVLSWETDANDVDLHVWDDLGHHSYFGRKELPGGGGLLADVTTGYGPEEFLLPLTTPSETANGPYKIGVHYYARGPMGFGMGKLEIVQHDGKGQLKFDERPYVIMVDRGGVDLGTYDPRAI